MKKQFYFFGLLFFSCFMQAQNVGIGTTTPDPSAILDLKSTTQGLLLPGMSSSNRNAIVSPANGLMVYDYTTKTVWVKRTSGWDELLSKLNNVWLESGNDIFHSVGNVGIGTNVPANRLQVHNSIGTDNFIRITNSVTGFTNTDGLLIGGIGANTSLMNLENGSLNLGTNNETVVSITNTRKVGIGINTPVAKLQVNGFADQTLPSLMLVDSGLNNGGVLKFKNVANTTGISFSEFSANNFNNGQYLDVKSDSITIATFQGNGRVGISNLEPSYPLDVNGDINTTGLIRLNGNAGNIGQILTSNGTSDPTWAAPAGLSHYAGELFGGGIIVAVWKIAGVEHGLIASLTNLSTGAAWSNVTAPAVGTNAYDGQANTNAIIAQPGQINSAAKLCNDYSSGGFTDWYLPAAWELYQCFTVAHIVNTVLGPANGFGFTSSSYWSSTEDDQTYAYSNSYYRGAPSSPKGASGAVRVVRKF